jgi:hypothetical protein
MMEHSHHMLSATTAARRHPKDILQGSQGSMPIFHGLEEFLFRNAATDAYIHL